MSSASPERRGFGNPENETVADSLISFSEVPKADDPMPATYIAKGNSPIHGTSLGEPTRKGFINWVDALATLVSILCLIAAILVISPSFAYAAELAYTRQIIVVGFLLGIMTQCMLRTVPHAFLLIEARYGRSTLQNFDGLLRWTPLADSLGAVWRILLILLLLLPLGLSVAYKRYTGGLGDTQSVSGIVGLGPTAPGQTQGVGFVNTMANATLPFVARTIESETLPDFVSESGQVYGYNLVLFSETEAAALDVPLPDNVSSIQQSLGPNEVAILSADVKGTAARLHPLTDADRTNSSWESAWKYGIWKDHTLWNGYDLGFLAVSTAVGNDAEWYNSSWTYVGTFPVTGDDDGNRLAFQRTASLVTISRVSCSATWNVTSSSMLLASATCGDELGEGYQYYTNCQLGVAELVPPLLADYLGPFAITRNESRWRLPTYAISVASMYQSRIASYFGIVPIQIAGPIQSYWALNADAQNGSYPINQTTGAYQERYNGTLTKTIQRPALRSHWSLYVILAIEPFLAVMGFITICMLHAVPLGHGFGLISVLAGVQRERLDVLAGATLSGKTKKPVSVELEIVDRNENSNTDFAGDLPAAKRIRYLIDCKNRRHQQRRLDTKVKYH